jgi:hypothetical protein
MFTRTKATFRMTADTRQARRLSCGRYVVIALAAATVMFGSAVAVHASVILYEGFDYGTESGALAGEGGDTTGFTSSETWAGTANTYDSADLGPVGDNTAAGGSAFAGVANQNLGASTRGIDATVTAGTTIFGVYLFQLTSATQPATSQMPRSWTTFTNSAAATQFGVFSTHFGSAVNFQPLVGATVGTADDATFVPTTQVTYTVLFEVTNLNGALGSSDITMWVLNPDQVNNFLADDAITVAELAAALTANGNGSAANQISQSGTASSATAVTFDTDHILSITSRQPNTNLAGHRVDEVTLSNMSFNDVFGIVVIPAPAALPSGLILLTLAAMRRRRHR